ncbi:MAG TPA: winged helix DNA-binding protein [Stellaceae bacterium]|nr:winged helix DNA-binding protein [Stellaceae bacterium]
MQTAYMDLIALVERLHRQFLEVVKLELDTNSVHDINNVQAMILYNIGDMEMTVGELTLRGCYLGSNVSYNVKKMLENGYIVQERSPHDRRSVRVRLTEKGLALHEKLNAMHERHIGALGQGVLSTEELTQAHKTLRRLERFWTQAVELGARNLAFTSAA